MAGRTEPQLEMRLVKANQARRPFYEFGSMDGKEPVRYDY